MQRFFHDELRQLRDDLILMGERSLDMTRLVLRAVETGDDSLALQVRHHGVTVLMVHAGVLPAWTCEKTMALAQEVQAVLRGPDYADFLAHMYSNLPDQWDEGLQGHERLRLIVNALTRIRFCDAQGRMEFDTKEGLAATPAGFSPWFDAPGRRRRPAPRSRRGRRRAC
ncbi:MAG: hypothetical protein EBR83_09990, partial [Verrucomicrobia bacterium]|nr:hypothetical protein [Verrucomicrobiota bacterium]